MRLGWRELVRRPGRFLTAGAALTLITLLLLVLGGILDRLIAASTGVLRAQSAPLIAFSADSRDSLNRSRVSVRQLQDDRAVEGVREATGFGVALLAAHVPGQDEPADAALFGYEAANRRVPAPPDRGQVYADRSLEDQGVALGQRLELGPARIPVEVVGWVEDTSYNLQDGLWAEPETWREALSSSLPDAALADGSFQAGLVTPRAGADPTAVADAVERAVPELVVRTIDEAIAAIPGVEQQESVFGAIIGVTFAVAGLVVAFFFALLTIERTGLLGVLKAVGASSGQLAAALIFQALMIAAGALVIGGGLALGLERLIRDTVPIAIAPARFAFTAVGLVVTALVGGALSFRRLIRVDPASASGALEESRGRSHDAGARHERHPQGLSER